MFDAPILAVSAVLLDPCGSERIMGVVVISTLRVRPGSVGSSSAEPASR